jgi:hypothetical protein
MGLFVTDADVIAQLDLNDAQARQLDAQVTAIRAQLSPVTLAAWTADRASWSAWSSAARARLSGGFLFGEWFGVPAEGNAAIAWKLKLDRYGAIFDAIANGKPPASLVPATPTAVEVGDAENAAVAHGVTSSVGDVAGSLEGSLKWGAIALVAILGIGLIARK